MTQPIFLEMALSKNDPEAWFHPDCLEDHSCYQFVRIVEQIQFLLSSKGTKKPRLDGLGSLMQNIAETMFGNIFRLNSVYGDHKLILDSKLWRYKNNFSS